MKKVFLFLLAAAMIATFSQCSKDKKDNPKPQETEAVATASVKHDGEQDAYQFIGMNDEAYPVNRDETLFMPAVYDGSSLSLFFADKKHADPLSFIRIDMENVTGAGTYVLEDWGSDGYVLYYPFNMVTSHDFYTTSFESFKSQATIHITTFKPDYIAGTFEAILYNRENGSLKISISDGKFSCSLKHVDHVQFWD